MLKTDSPYSECYMLLRFKNSDNSLKPRKPENLRLVHTIKPLFSLLQTIIVSQMYTLYPEICQVQSITRSSRYNHNLKYREIREPMNLRHCSCREPYQAASFQNYSLKLVFTLFLVPISSTGKLQAVL